MSPAAQIGINRLPDELLLQILKCVRKKDIPRLILSSKKFQHLATPYLYNSVYSWPRPYSYFRSVPEDIHKFKLAPAHGGAFRSAHSTQIFHPEAFARTLRGNGILRSYVQDISFELYGEGSAINGALLDVLNLIHPISQHLAFRFCEEKVLTSNVTSLDIGYRGENALEDENWFFEEEIADMIRLHGSTELQDEVYSIFQIPTLRYLTLRDARSWNCFGSSAVDRVGTSNIVSLSLVRTVPMDRDLEEILTWPKALKYYHHESVIASQNSFVRHIDGALASPQRFLQGLARQKQSLEELHYNHKLDWRKDDETIFDPVLIREFAQLKYLTVPLECFVQAANPETCCLLPPNAEEITIDAKEQIFGRFTNAEKLKYESRLRNFLTLISIHKQKSFPYLRHVVLKESLCEDHPDGNWQALHAFVDRLSLGQAFAEVGIKLEIIFVRGEIYRSVNDGYDVLRGESRWGRELLP